MVFKRKSALAVVILLSSVMSSHVMAAAAEGETMEQRVERLERIIKGQGLISLLTRVDQLQNEVKRLNGDNETLRHQLEEMQRRNRQLYLDLDERLSQQQAATATQPSQPIVTTAGSEAETVKQSDASESSAPQETATQPAVGEGAPSESVPVAVENGEAAYQSALQTLRSGLYEEAVSALTAFPEQYPQSSYLPNVYYWRGEANYVLRKFEDAIASFQTVLDKFPDSIKIPDAMLKRGFSEYEMDNVDAAKATLTTVMQQYPDTAAARLAKVRLDRIKQESR